MRGGLLLEFRQGDCRFWGLFSVSWSIQEDWVDLLGVHVLLKIDIDTIFRIFDVLEERGILFQGSF